MAKKLFAFWSDERTYHFFALVPAHMPDHEVQALALAATSDANREDDARTEQGITGWNDGLCVEEGIKGRLKELGFEFIDKPEGVTHWEDFRQGETLLEARLRLAGVSFVRDHDGNLTIDTPVGAIAANVVDGAWSGQGTSGDLKTTLGATFLIDLIRMRMESQAVQ